MQTQHQIHSYLEPLWGGQFCPQPPFRRPFDRSHSATETVSRASQPCLYRILLNISLNTLELRVGSNQMIVAFILPKWAMGTEKKIGLMSSESLERTQPFSGEHVRSDQNVHMIRHHDESVQLIPVQFALSVPQRRHHHLGNFRSPQKQRTGGTCVQQPVDSHKRLARGNESRRRKHPIGGKTAMQSERDEQRLINRVPMGQPSLVMPHSSSWCIGGRETLTASSGLTAGCGQYCPPHGAR